MNDVLIIRHAETDMAGTFCGQSDPPVNTAGHRQIQNLIASLHTERFQTIFTSDLQRSATTARALADSLTIPTIIRPALREIDFGQWEGLTWQQIEERDPTFAAQWLESFPRLTPPDGESVECFEARVTAEINDLLLQSEAQPIAIVTHAGVMRVILRTLCGIDDNSAWALTKSHCCTFRCVPQTHPNLRLQEVLV